MSFVLAVRNQGPDDATGVTVQDPGPVGVVPAVGAAKPGDVHADRRAAGLPARIAGQRRPGAGVGDYTVAADATGTLVNEASVFGDQSDPDPANNIARSAITVTPLPVRPPYPGPQPIANLIVTKHVSRSTAVVGQT